MSFPTFTAATTAEEVATAFANQIMGKNVLITGTSINGIGFETARVLAKYANLVIITGYNSERLKLSKEAIKKEVPGANIRQLVLDLSSLAAVRKAAAEVNAYAEPLHVLINNAAAPAGTFKLTVDNLETQIATDHIGPFLFTKLFVPKLLAARTERYTPRVVIVASLAHTFGSGIDLNMVANADPEKYKGSHNYFQAKSANILFGRELSQRAGGKLNAFSLHPGIILTNINSDDETMDKFAAAGMLTADRRPQGPNWKTIPQGAATTVTAAFDPRLDDTPGAYLSDCTVATETIASHTSNPETAAKLWAITEDVIGEKFTL